MPFMSLHCLDHCVFLLTWESFLFYLFIQILNQQDFYSRNMLALKKNKTKTKPLPTILSTQTLAKYKYPETGKTLHYLVCNPTKLVFYKKMEEGNSTTQPEMSI